MSNFKRILEQLETDRLNEGKKEDLDKVIRTIKSAKTSDQIGMAMRMGQNLIKTYGPTFFDRIKKVLYPGYEGEDFEKLFKTYMKKKAELEHETKVKG